MGEIGHNNKAHNIKKSYLLLFSLVKYMHHSLFSSVRVNVFRLKSLYSCNFQKKLVICEWDLIFYLSWSVRYCVILFTQSQADTAGV